MRIHTNNYKSTLSGVREINTILTNINNNTVINNDYLNKIKPILNGDLFKSNMKELYIESKTNIPINTELNFQFGVKVNNAYEYINYGNYIVYESEYQADTKIYAITCYDKMLYSMTDYKSMNITYPITIRNYINAISTYLGLTFANIEDTFANYDKQIQNELYLDSQGNSLGYTFRDVLTELAQATASTICINNNDELELRYITDTNDIINEDFLKSINVEFGEKYGPVNTIVLSRSAGSDNIYLSYPENLPEEDKKSIKFTDNQIMNFNDRDTYLPDILQQIYGLEYYLNDFESPGITYLELCDKYNIQIGETLYPCIMINDELEITKGLSETIYTEKLEEEVTDYTKSDKTDRRINQTYLIVDKQNQVIESVVSNVSEQNTKISQITQTVDELNSKISDIADITTSAEDTDAQIYLNDINESEPIQLKIHPIGTNISYLYPRSNLYPSSSLFSTTRTIRFHNNTTNEDIDYILPEDLLYYDSNNYDEFLLDYGDGTLSQICQVTKKCKYNADGTVGLLSTPEIHDYTVSPYTYPSIILTDGDYTVSILNYNTGYIFARLMAKNIYTTQFYTRVETDSRINQKANEIELGVNQTLSNYSTTSQMNSAINLKANEITSTVSETYATKTTTNQLSSRISQTAKNISLTVNNGSTSSGIIIGITKEDGTTSQTTGTIQMNGLVKFTDLSTSGSTTINGSNITTGNIKSSNYVANTSGTLINLSNGVIDTKNFKLSNTGIATLTGAIFTGGTIQSSNYVANTSGTKIDLSTGAIDTKNFKVNNTGNITATGGKIGGWNITSNQLQKSTGNYSLEIRTDRASNEPTLLVYDNSANQYNWYVRPDGYMYCRNANVSGAIYAAYGSLGSWTLNSTDIYGIDANGYEVSLSPSYLSAKAPGDAWEDVRWYDIVFNYSDKRVKNSIEPIDDKYEKFYNNLKPSSFKFDKQVRPNDYDKIHFGFIAQDILESEKNYNLEDLSMITKSDSSGRYQLDKQELIALNTWQIQKLKQQLQEQQEEIEELKKEIKSLKGE